jgi:hypothetical protein
MNHDLEFHEGNAKEVDKAARELANLYARVFGSVDGKRVLEDLFRKLDPAQPRFALERPNSHSAARMRRLAEGGRGEGFQHPTFDIRHSTLPAPAGAALRAALRAGFLASARIKSRQAFVRSALGVDGTVSRVSHKVTNSHMLRTVGSRPTAFLRTQLRLRDLRRSQQISATFLRT